MANTNFKPWLGSGATTGEQTYYNVLIESVKFESGNLIKAEDFNALLRMTTLVCAGIAGAWGFDNLSIDASEDAITTAIKNYELPTLKAATATIKNLTVPAGGTASIAGTETVTGTLNFGNAGDVDLTTLRAVGSTIYTPGLYAISVYSNFNTVESSSAVVILNAEEFVFAAGSVRSSIGALKIEGSKAGIIFSEIYVAGFPGTSPNTLDLKAYAHLDPDSTIFEEFTPIAIKAYRIGPALPTGATPVPFLVGRYNWTLYPMPANVSADITFTDLQNTSYKGVYWKEDVGANTWTLCYTESTTNEEVEAYIHYDEPPAEFEYQGEWISDAFKTISISPAQEVSDAFKTWFLKNAYIER